MVNTQKIKKRMKELKLSQGDLANALNIKRPTMSQKINNVRPIGLDEAEKLCEVLKINPLEFSSYFFSKELGNCETNTLSQVRFNNMHRQYCELQGGQCEKCNLRVYCFTAPRERTDSLMEMIIFFILEELNPDVDVNTLPDYYSTIKAFCPARLHFKGAVGYEEIFKHGRRP